MTLSTAPVVPGSESPALFAEFTAWQALVTEPAPAVDWLDEELDRPDRRERGRVAGPPRP